MSASVKGWCVMDDDSKPRRTRPYSISEAAEKLGICKNTAYALAKKGELPTIKLGRLILVAAPALDRLLDGQA